MDIGIGSGGTKWEWEEALTMVNDGCLFAFTNGSRDVEGKAAGGWYGPCRDEWHVMVGS